MYPGPHARERADQAAFVMASTGQSVSYAEYEARTNRLAHLLRARGLGRLDHYAIFMENNDRYLEACGAGERAGLYYTCVNSYLTAPELAYILNNSDSRFLITSRACREVALEAARGCPGLTAGLIVDGTGDDGIFADFEDATRGFPATPIGDESLGTAMLYSSGTTGRPKGILRPLDDIPPGDSLCPCAIAGWRRRRCTAARARSARGRAYAPTPAPARAPSRAPAPSGWSTRPSAPG
ncbi:MAG TPA: AMP-binding protein [Streptosporangiaceae bacterium]